MKKRTVDKPKASGLRPIAYTIADAAVVSGLRRTKIYELIGRGKLKAVKADGRTLILAGTLHSHIENLPPADISTGQRTRALYDSSIPATSDDPTQAACLRREGLKAMAQKAGGSANPSTGRMTTATRPEAADVAA